MAATSNLPVVPRLRPRSRLLAPALAALTLLGAAPDLASPVSSVALPTARGGALTAVTPGRAAGAASTEPGHPAVPTADNPQGCDPIDPAQCLLPFPDDWFSKADATSATGRRVDIPPLATPRNAAGAPISVTDYNRADGFSVGAPLVTKVPGLEGAVGRPGYRDFPALTRSRIATQKDMAASLSTEDGLVVLDAATGQRVMVWAELDMSTDLTSDAQRLLLIHSGSVWRHGHRYVVALQHLQTATGNPVPAQAPFAAYKAGRGADARRQAHLQTIFTELGRAGLATDDLYLAWDFTTASTADTTGRLLAMRDDAFATLGDTTMADLTVQGSSPAVSITTVTDHPAPDPIAREVVGSVTVPCYLTPSCATTGPDVFALPPTDPDARPTRTPGQTMTADFQCELPRQAFTAPTAGSPPTQLRPSLYGHGLFGGEGEAGAGHVKDMASEHGMLECGVRWFGMATADVPNALAALTNLSAFPALIDRVQQGELGFLFAGRAMIHPQGFCAQAAFRRADGSCVIDTQRLYYDGNSQGGIYGGTVVAVSPDLTRGVLGVPGMGYATLLPRSSDYVARCPATQTDPADPRGCIGYSTAFDAGYPDPSQRMLILSLIQNLWDRGDPAGYAEHMTADPLPRTPAHAVLLQVGYGDHQVANVTAEAEARTVGAGLVSPPLLEGRASYDHYPAIQRIGAYPYAGSGMTIFDTGPIRTESASTRGVDEPPSEDVPPRLGEDPHEAPRRSLCGRQQKSDFLQPAGLVTLPCSAPLFAGSFTGVLAGPPTSVVPEAPWAPLLLLPGLAVAAVVVVRRRRSPSRERPVSVL